MLRDIKAAWPRERRFTWRGWVLLVVLGILIVAAACDWNPVNTVQMVVNERWGSPAMYSLSIVLNQVILVFAGQFVISLPTMMGLIPTVVLLRPARNWLIYPVLLALALTTSLFHLSLWFISPGPLGLGLYESMMLGDLVVSVVWAGVLWRVFRTWLVPAWVLLSTAAMYALAIGITGPWRAAKGAGWDWYFYWSGLGWPPEIIAFHILVPMGLVVIALRSWHVPPEHLCPTCNYDRRGLKSPTCPECGTPIDAPNAAKK